MNFPFTGVINTNKVNVRAGQDNNFESLGVLNKGDSVVVAGKSFSWYQIKLPEQAKCYVNRKLVHFLRDEIGEINANRVNIRARADLNSAVIGQLNKMTKVKLVETLDDWYRIAPVEGLHGWVLADFIDFHSQEVGPPVTVQLPTKNVYEIKRQEEEKRKAEEARKKSEEEQRKVSLRGMVALSAVSAGSENIRHEITTDDGKTFYLMGYRSVLDGFLNHRVQIEGLPQDEADLDLPVLLVTRIQLVL